MSMSFGQHMADGHSHGSLGHGGQHRVGGHGTAVGSIKPNIHTQNSDAGHTMSNSHGGTVPMGC